MAFDIDQLSKKIGRREATKLGAVGAAAVFGAIPIIGRAQDEERKRRPGRKPGGSSTGLTTRPPRKPEFENAPEAPPTGDGERMSYGQYVTAGTYTWLAAPYRADGSWMGGSGCIGGRRKFVTAAHVVAYETQAIRIVAGHPNREYARTNIFQANAVSVAVHPSYNLSTQCGPDIAVVTIDRDFPGNLIDLWLPLRNDHQFVQVGKRVKLGGWGMEEDDGFDDWAKWANMEVKVQPSGHVQGVCSYPQNFEMKGVNQWEYGCQGDSGGPVWRTDPATGYDLLVGVLSMGSAGGTGCGDYGHSNHAVRTTQGSVWDFLVGQGVSKYPI